MFRDHKDNIPSVNCIDDDWNGWIGLNCEPSFVSVHVDEAKDLANWHERLVGSAGEFLDLEPATEADWYRREIQWEGWIPLDSVIQPKPWYFDMIAPIPYTPMEEGFFVKEEHLTVCRENYESIESYVEEITQCDRFPIGTPRPAPFDITQLAKGFVSIRELQKAGAASKRAILSRLGFLSWWMSSVSKWYQVISDETVNRIESLRPRFGRKKGYIVDFEEYWREVNVSLWLKHQLPIYYRLTWTMRRNPRFTKIDPRLIMALADAEQEGVSLYDIGEFNVEEKKLVAEKYDEFFQP
ncbi:hypothetical protein GALMADRAFT_51145, partial [Galerina marginata CBS 339.88]